MKAKRFPWSGMTVKVALDIPSGKLVFEDSLGFDVEKTHSVNQMSGIKHTIIKYGEVGCFHGYCGNSCPAVYKKGDKLYIGREHWEEDDMSSNPTEKLPGKKVGGICTDLWWYSFADYDLAKEKGLPVDQFDSVDVEPGRYVLTHWLDEDDYDEYKTRCTVYATIEKSDEEIVNITFQMKG